jgi:methyl-accepting chemotaxis protein
MKDNKIEPKISYRFSLVFAIGLFLSLLFLGFFLQGYFNFKLIGDQKIETEIIKKQFFVRTITEMLVLSPVIDSNLLTSRINEIIQLPEMENIVYFKIIDPSGIILYSTITEERDEKIDNFQLPSGELIEENVFSGRRIKTITAISPSNNFVVQLGFSVDDIFDARSAFLRFLISDIIFLFLIGLCFFVLFKIIIRPVKELTHLCNEMRRGKLVARPIQSDIQEIDNLTVAFNKMISDLREYKTRLEETKDILQIKVKARTKELEELAESLEEKVNQRTEELQERIDQLEKFHKLTVGRELKMIELKKEIKKK